MRYYIILCTYFEYRVSDFKQFPCLLGALGECLSNVDLVQQLTHVLQPHGNDILNSGLCHVRKLVLHVVKGVDGFSKQADGGCLYRWCNLKAENDQSRHMSGQTNEMNLRLGC